MTKIEKKDAKPQAEKDARGQSESKHAGGSNDGVTSADPRALSKKENGDATFPLDQSEKKKPAG
jgi:hypothetical protein